MVKKLVVKKLKSVAKDSQLSATIRDSAQQIWLAGLGAFAKAQEEGNKVFDALIRVARSLNSLGVPTKDDVAQLAKRVAELKAEVEKLNRGAAKAAKPAAAAKPVRRAAPKAAAKAAPKAAA